MAEAVIPVARLNVTTVGDLYGELLSRDGQDIVCNMSAVTHFGALALQTLLSAAASAREQGKTLRLINTTDRVLAQMRIMGVCPETIAEGRT